MKSGARWWWVVVYAVGMAWVEAAVVYYLRTLSGDLQPQQPGADRIPAALVQAEVVREGATLVMLLAVGWLAGINFRQRVGFLLIAFGIWDMFYYVFLRVMCAWPKSILDWDLLFLIPLPWWGPVLAPGLIALLMVLWGTALTQFESPHVAAHGTPWIVGLCLAGCGLALYVFMADAIQVAGQGVEALRKMRPERFRWEMFLPALGLMAAPVLSAYYRIWQTRAVWGTEAGEQAEG